MRMVVVALALSACVAGVVSAPAPVWAQSYESPTQFGRNDWLRQNGFFGAQPQRAAPQPQQQRAQPQQRSQARPTRQSQQPARVVQPAAPVQAAPAPPPRDFFSMLFGGGRPEPVERRVYEPESSSRPSIVITPRSSGSSGRSSSRARSSSGEEAVSKAAVGGGAMPGSITYCVRSCDGRYFPLNHGSSRTDKTPIAQCNAFCPAASMDVYVSNNGEKGIEEATNKDGKRYSSLPNAFAFRQRMVPDCSCNAKGGLGMPPIAVTEDPTLKRGDIVMTENGARVFTGARSRPPFRASDFVTPARFPELSSTMRKRLEELTLASRT